MTLSIDAGPDGALTEHLLQEFELGYEMVCELADGFDEDTARTAPPGHQPLLWFFGHLACAKDYVSFLYQGAGLNLPLPFFDLWAEDGGKVDYATAPSVAEMFGIYRETHERLRELVCGMTVADLHRPPGEPVGEQFDDYWRTRLGKAGSALSLTKMHDTFHGGQLAALRGALGMTVPF
ncbi:DinB family protein [Actinokineospora sp.]|uniref:DinB family protein n=1 Tax=Actinokineospora sp. TaxID=1872133 RepID=UPI004037BDED